MKDKKRKNPLPNRLWPLFGTALFLLTACSGGYVRYLAPEEINNLAETPPLKVELKNGSTMTFVQPFLRKGKLIDQLRQWGANDKPLPIKEVPISDIKLVKVVKRSNALFSFIPAAIAAAWLILGEASAPPRPPSESCPFIYSWDGSQYVFEAEPYGGAVCRALQRCDWCRLDWLQASNGSYRIRVANELDETQYTDEVNLVAVDHEPGLRIVADCNGGLHAFGPCLAAVSARDEEGRDIRPLVSANDLLFWESEKNGDDLARKTDLRHELNFVFPKPAGARQVKLLANAWTSSWGAEVPKRFLATLGRDLPGFFEEVNRLGMAWLRLVAWFFNEELYLLRIQVKTDQGWSTRGYIQGGGPFVANDKAYLIDIGDVSGETLELRLCPPVTFWRINRLAVDYAPDPVFAAQQLAPRRALDQDGRDVTRLIAAADREYLVAPQAGNWADVDFDAPPRPAGKSRSFILKINGYYDIHMLLDAEPQRDLFERFLGERNFTIRFALDAYKERHSRNP